MSFQASRNSTAVDEDVEKSQLLFSPQWPSLATAKSSRIDKINSILKAVFYVSGTLCLWLLSFSAYQAATHHESDSMNAAPKPLFMGYGEGNWGIGEDVSGQVPVVEKQLWLFWNDSRFTIDDPRTASLEDEEALKAAWRSIVPEGNGFVLVDEPHNPALPPPINRDPEANIPMDRFCLTVFHQLHCLRGIQEAFYSLVRDPTSEPMLAHVNHCVDYIREGVMCYGDTALEGQSTYSSKDRANGNGSTHVCKGFGALLDWANDRSSHKKAREFWEKQKGRFGTA